MQLTPEQLCEKFDIERVSSQFLKVLTKLNAASVYKHRQQPDEHSNWVEGEKMTAFMIADCYLRTCKKKNSCIPVNECIHEYLDRINITDIIKLKAYFIWDARGRNINDEAAMEGEYFEGYDDLLEFCDKLPVRGHSCRYNNEILKRMDRRKKERRKPVNQQSDPFAPERRTNQDRRQFDYRGSAAQFLL
jgi:hypothetical protein